MVEITPDLKRGDSTLVYRNDWGGIWGSGPLSGHPIPFSPQPAWVFDPSGFLWSGAADSYVFQKRSLNGDTLMSVLREYTMAPVTERERADTIEWYYEHPKTGMDLEMIPSVKPAYSQFLVDDLSHLWVLSGSTTDSDRAPFDVFTPDGQYLGQVIPPFPVARRPRPIFRNGYMYAVTRDQHDVLQVVKAKIERS